MIQEDKYVKVTFILPSEDDKRKLLFKIAGHDVISVIGDSRFDLIFEDGEDQREAIFSAIEVLDKNDILYICYGVTSTNDYYLISSSMNLALY